MKFQLRQRGMTLVETIVVIAIFTMILSAITETIITFYRQNAYTIAQANQVSHARRGVEFMVRDIREMAYADDGAFPLSSMEPNAISFFSDIDRDDSVELVEYRLASTTLYKYVYDATGFPPTYNTGTPDQTFIISEYVQNALQSYDIFEYRDTTGANLSATSSVVSDVRYVGVNLIINIDPLRDPGEFSLRSSASLRNLKGSL